MIRIERKGRSVEEIKERKKEKEENGKGEDWVIPATAEVVMVAGCTENKTWCV
jgi:hypothetical protein